ncbi:phosphatidate cytidylyltransferase [Actinomycetospora lemnae]|uniref:Phosphatidate cytidylyltransferase n=1 Tax=Actinomycetospora lemnae TaxID=3019891 RepID=A0ABT5SNT5_9PSEU|nr:phosphatidate cytidylyltransferase [Actinomycetospora sp. DW7H6]MDD7964341.1 phosphatidate cytidylyltransferase [Actinomycetospora sp. DW7H6]
MPSSASRPRRPAASAPAAGEDAPSSDAPAPTRAPGGQDKPPSSSKAGRNLPVAIGVGLAMGAVVLVALLTVRQAWIGIVAICAVIGTWELFGALHRAAGIRLSRVPVLVGGQAMIWLAWPFGTEGILGGLLVTVIGCFLWRMRLGAAGFVRDVGASMLVLCWIPLFMAFGTMLVVPADGAQRVLTFLIVVICSDTGGYAVGALIGRHPMAPKVSPKKSWEGFAGSIVFGSLGASLSIALLLDDQWWWGLVVGPLLVGTAVTGDLVESLVKRDLGIKDMGSVLPGHGGLMERLDSLVTSAPVAWLLLFLLVPVHG